MIIILRKENEINKRKKEKLTPPNVRTSFSMSIFCGEVSKKNLTPIRGRSRSLILSETKMRITLKDTRSSVSEIIKSVEKPKVFYFSIYFLTMDKPFKS